MAVSEYLAAFPGFPWLRFEPAMPKAQGPSALPGLQFGYLAAAASISLVVLSTFSTLVATKVASMLAARLG